MKLSQKYYYDVQTHGPDDFDFDAIYLDFYPVDIWENETRIPYIFEEDIYKKDIQIIKEFLLSECNISQDMIENDGSFSFYILDPSNKEAILEKINERKDMQYRQLPILHNEIPDAHKTLYFLKMVNFKPTETGAAQTDEQQLAAFIVPKKLLEVYLDCENPDFNILNRLKWASLDHRNTFSMQTFALTKNVAFDMLDIDGILFPCYPEDIEEKLPTDDFCNDIDLVKSIFDACNMQEEPKLESLVMSTCIQIGLNNVIQ